MIDVISHEFDEQLLASYCTVCNCYNCSGYWINITLGSAFEPKPPCQPNNMNFVFSGLNDIRAMMIKWFETHGKLSACKSG